jgi:hypothetical protein
MRVGLQDLMKPAGRLRRDRDQLLAEAVKLFNDGEHWWPPRDFEKQHIAPEQEARFEPDPWEEPIAAYLAKRPRTLTEKPTTTILDIAGDVLGFDPSPVTAQGKNPISRLEPRVQARIGAVLKHLGWVAKRDKGERWWELSD